MALRVDVFKCISEVKGPGHVVGLRTCASILVILGLFHWDVILMFCRADFST